jgi:hypothetical protein
MSFTAELGTPRSMPGNIALPLPPEGSSTGGRPPQPAASSPLVPVAIATHPMPRGS